MTKADIVSEIAAKTGIEKVAVSEIIENFFTVLKDNISKGNNIYFRGFGSFIIKNRARIVARNIAKNTSIIIEPHAIPSFKPAKTFVDDVRKIKVSSKKNAGAKRASAKKNINYDTLYNIEKIFEKGSKLSFQDKGGIINKDPTKELGGALKLYYGTNRNKTGKTNVNDFYGGEPDALKTGLCIVTIPPGHKQGEIERPHKILWWELNENQNEHIILSSINEMKNDELYNWLNKSLIDKKSSSVLLFVHGYNTSFAEAARRTGQMACDIPFNSGMTGFFSWPSTAKTIDYARDIERADASVPDLVIFIENLVQKGGVEKLHCIAHSMGNRILTQALIILSQKPEFSNHVKTIYQIVLAAPDIDKDVFDKVILPAFKSLGSRRTLYASDQDKALKFSKKLRDGLTRIGQAGKNIYIADGLDTIDASNVRSGGNHHSYVFEEKETLTDLYLLIEKGLAPDQRRLRPNQINDLKYWLFRE